METIIKCWFIAGLAVSSFGFSGMVVELSKTGHKKIKTIDSFRFCNEENQLPKEMVQEIVKHATPGTVHSLLLLNKSFYSQITSFGSSIVSPLLKKMAKRYIKEMVIFTPLLSPDRLGHNGTVSTKNNVTMGDEQEDNTQRCYSCGSTQSYHSNETSPVLPMNDTILINGEPVAIDTNLLCFIPNNNTYDEKSNLEWSNYRLDTLDVSHEFDTTIFTDIIKKYQIPSDEIKKSYTDFPESFRNLFSSIAHKIADNGVLRLYHTIDDAVKSGYLYSITSWKFYELLSNAYKKQKTDVKIIDLLVNDTNNYLITGSYKYVHEPEATNVIFCAGSDNDFLEYAIKQIVCSHEQQYSSIFDGNDIVVIVKSHDPVFLTTFFGSFSPAYKEKIIDITVMGDFKQGYIDDVISLWLQGYKNLKSLRLSKLQLTAVPTCIKHCSQLKKIYLDGNSIINIFAEDFPGKINTVDLRDNPTIMYLGDFIAAMKSKYPQSTVLVGKSVMQHQKHTLKDSLSESLSD